MNIMIEKAAMSDVANIQKLNEKLFRLEVSSGFDPDLDIGWSLSEEGGKEIEERISSENESCGFIAKDGEKIIGYLIGRILEEETGRAQSRYADLEHMFIDDKYRGKGIGRQLIDAFKLWSKSQGLKLVKVNVSYKNADAIEFYKKNGLAAVDITMVGEIE